MTTTVNCLFALFIMLSVISCTNASDGDAGKTDSTGQRANNNGQAVTSKLENTDQDTTTQTSNQPASSDAKGDTSIFHKVLSHKNISFTVTTKGKGSLQQLTIQPSGLSQDNRTVVLETEPVTSAAIGDLNADGYPELLVFTRSAGSGSYGKVLAYSVNNGRSMSLVAFPATSDNPRINKGYMGHDQFTVVNNQLTQSFPLYKEGDVNSKPTGKNRVVTYKLKDGEASRIFEVDQVKE